MAIHVPKKDLDFILGILRKNFPNAKIFVFGSRVRGDHKQYSDLDICIDVGGPIPLGAWSSAEESFSQSDLLYKVDLTDWHRITEDFRKVVIAEGKVLN
jgi:predicted nucleotidyltransferase